MFMLIAFESSVQLDTVALLLCTTACGQLALHSYLGANDILKCGKLSCSLHTVP